MNPSRTEGNNVAVSPFMQRTGSQQPPSLSVKVKQRWDFVFECIIKEFFSSCLRHAWYRVIFWIDPHKYEMNPIHITHAKKANEIAKVVLCLHADAAHQSSFIPLVNKISEILKEVYQAELDLIQNKSSIC